MAMGGFPGVLGLKMFCIILEEQVEGQQKGGDAEW